MKRRIWDENGCGWENVTGRTTGHLVHTKKIDGLTVSVFNYDHGRSPYFYLIVKGKSTTAFEKSFDLLMETDEIGADEIVGRLRECSKKNLPKLKKQLQEILQAEKEADEQEAASQKRWAKSEWNNIRKLLKAARAAGWVEEKSCRTKNHRFSAKVGKHKGKTLCLILGIDNSGEIRDCLWLRDGVEVQDNQNAYYPRGHWVSPLANDIEFVERWDGIPTPKQAVAAFKAQHPTWRENYCY